MSSRAWWILANSAFAVGIYVGMWNDVEWIGYLVSNQVLRAALYAAYMPFLRGGGIFIPTSRPYTLGEEVFMLLSLMDDPNRIAVQGKVVWITPEGVQGNRTQGIGVQFTQDETGASARATIERILGESLASTRSTHTM